MVAKGNDKSTVHRRAHMDVVAIKLHGEGGKITGQLRIAGLFTASAYNLSTLSVPLLRQKIVKVLRGSGYPAGSFSERALLNVLETFPRDELFQISAEQLVRVTDGILKTSLTPRPRVFIRRDGFERFISAFVYVPRERYNTQVRVEIVKTLEEAFGGRLESFTPFFPEGSMVRIHIVIWREEESLKDATGLDAALHRFYLAMCYHRLGDSKAKDCFDRAVGWRAGQKSLPAALAELFRSYQADAENVLNR